MRSNEIVFAKSKKDVSFSYSTITDDEEFGQVIIGLISLHQPVYYIENDVYYIWIVQMEEYTEI